MLGVPGERIVGSRQLRVRCGADGVPCSSACRTISQSWPSTCASAFLSPKLYPRSVTRTPAAPLSRVQSVVRVGRCQTPHAPASPASLLAPSHAAETKQLLWEASRSRNE